MTRSRTCALVGLVVLAGLVMLAELTAEARREDKALDAEVGGHDRYVDMGVVLRVVRIDQERGEVLSDGGAPVVVVREHHRGGICDTHAVPPSIVGPSEDPTVWYCSEDQEPLILHGDDIADCIMAIGSEGSGKTSALVRWHFLEALKTIGSGYEAGQTAPTGARLDRFHDEVARAWNPRWYTYNKGDGVYTLADGQSIRCLSTHQPSKAEGARVQGFNWVRAGSDELQDHLDKNADIVARGRSAPGGRYRRFCTATAKDFSAWRSFRDGERVAKSKHGGLLWTFRTLLGIHSPFVHPDWWETLRNSISEREFNRRALAHDVGPERQTYNTWSRADNLRMVPLGARDVTARVLQHWGSNLTCLVGFDPGKLFDVSLILKAYEFPGLSGHVWFVVDEVTTEQSTTEQHCDALLAVLRGKWDCNKLDYNGRPDADGNRALVRADPYSDSTISAAAEKPDRSVYVIFRQRGLNILPAAFSAKTDVVKPGTVPREAGINMVCGLLLSAAGTRRLFVACDDRRQPLAPRLVEAIEMSERDELGKAEQARKDKTDLSHWPAALRYALWVLEKPRMERAA